MDDINQAPVFKSIDDPWIGLLVLSIFTFVLSIIAMLVLYYFWRRHKRRTQFYNESYILSNNPTGKSQIPIQIQDQQPIPYETQVYILNKKQKLFCCFILLNREWMHLFQRAIQKEFMDVIHLMMIFSELINFMKGLVYNRSLILFILFFYLYSRTTQGYF
jgi:cbb3-type cytochrome oxidase subunit 3